MHELRKDPVLSRWVAVLENSLGPEDYDLFHKDEQDGQCVLCPTGEADWLVKSIQSPTPLLVPEGELGRRGVGMYDKMNSIGINEIIIESPEHDKPPEDIGPEQMTRVVELMKERLLEIVKDERLRFALISKNSGALAGSLSSHPHSQIIATPVIPMRIKAELDGAKTYYAYKERCIFCDMLDEEMRVKSRVIIETEHFLAFCPFASKFSFESWVLPKRHMCEFQSMNSEETEDLGRVMTSLLRKMRSVLREPSYSYVVHAAPQRIPRRNHWHTLGDDYHWHIEIVPRLFKTSGFEWGSGFYVLSTAPEEAAKYFRED
jgi:UDPglucose--hexose-1-phosphate uridylyltransferase